MVSFGELQNLLASLYFIFGNRILQPILSFFFGPWTSKVSSHSLKSFNILANIKPYFEVHHRDERSFLLKFGGWKDLSYLEREDVSLYSVSEKEFVFVRTKPGIDLYNTEQHPFLFEIQHTAAVELLTVPLDTILEYLRSKSARDGSNISFLYNTGRSGSTLLATMMYKTKQFVVQSEPNPILKLALIFNVKDYVISRNTTKYLNLVRATILLTCPDPNNLYFIKPAPCFTVSFFPLLKQALPGITELFNYRAIIPTLVSYKKLFGNYLTNVANKGMLLLPFNYRNIWRKIKPENDVGEKAFALQILMTVHAFLLETRDRDDIKTFTYEALMENKVEYTERLLKEVGVGEEYVSDALSALDNHSQAKSDITNQLLAISRSRSKKNTVSDGCVEWIRKIAYEELGIEIDKETGRYSKLE